MDDLTKIWEDWAAEHAPHLLHDERDALEAARDALAAGQKWRQEIGELPRKLRIKAYDEFDAIARDSSETITEVRVGNFPKRLWYRVRLAAQLHQTHIRVIVIAALTKFLDDLGIEE